MATDREQWADSLSADTSGGWLAGFFADEDELDRRSLWRFGSWGVGAVAAVTVAVLANQHGMNLRRDQVAAADVVRQSQQIQLVAREGQNEARRLASAIETLNSDRDRLYTRVTVLEQGLESVTGAISQQQATAAPVTAPAPAVSASAAPEVPTVSPAGAPLPAIPALPALAATTPPPVPAAPATTTAALTAKPAEKGDRAPAKTAADKAASDKTAPDKPATDKTADKPAIDKSVAEKPITEKSASEKPVAETPVADKPKSDKPGAIVALAADPTPPMTPLMPAKSMMAPPDPAATRLTEPDAAAAAPALPPPQSVASLPASVEPESEPTPVIAVQRTEFGIDLGGANSVDGLRALWRGLLKYRANKALAELRPIIVVKERSGSGMGMQLRLVAGPLSDAATAAKICATLTENDQTCETTVFDGQRLALKGDTSAPAAAPPTVTPAKPAPAPTRSYRRRGGGKTTRVEEPAKDAAKPPPARPSLSSMLGLSSSR